MSKASLLPLLLSLACIRHPPPSSPPPAPALAPARVLHGTIEVPDQIEEAPYDVTCPETPRLSGAELAALLDKQRVGLMYRGSEMEPPYDEVIHLPGPFPTLDEATFRRVFNRPVEPDEAWASSRQKERYLEQGMNEEFLVSLVILNDEGANASEGRRDGAAFVCSLVQQLDGLNRVVFAYTEAEIASPGFEGGTHEVWIVGLAIDGSLVAVRTSLTWT